MKCLCSSVRHASRVLSRYYESELQQVGLTPAQFELISTLSARPDLPQAQLAEALGLDQTTLSRNLKILIGRGLILRATSEVDGRQYAYKLSSPGHALQRNARRHWQCAQVNMQRKLGSHWQVVWSSLERLTSAAVSQSQVKNPIKTRVSRQNT